MTTGLQLALLAYVCYMLYRAWESPWAIVIIAISCALFLLAITPFGAKYPYLCPPPK